MNKETHHIKAEAEKIKINPSHKVWEKLELQLDNTSLRKSYHQLALKYAASLLFLVSIGLMLYIVYKPTLNTRVESFTYDMEIDQQYRYMFESLRNVSFENTSEENYNHSNFDL